MSLCMTDPDLDLTSISDLLACKSLVMVGKLLLLVLTSAVVINIDMLPATPSAYTAIGSAGSISNE